MLEFLRLCEIAPYGWDPGMAIIFTPSAEMSPGRAGQSSGY